jgi:hypothetical protein
MFVFVLCVWCKALVSVIFIHIYLRNCVVSSLSNTIHFQELSSSFRTLLNLLIFFPPLSSVNMDE